ncbi:MAG: TonB-dependent receptor [Porticoccaceae bacterium]|nr:TonB-dependent receptor [Porticoccaceae bacterium]
MGAKVSPVRLSPARISPVVLAVAALVAMPGAARGEGLSALSLDELVDSASLEDLGNLVVTAQRREERAQDVGLSLTALSGDGLRDKPLANLLALQYQVPNLEIIPLYGGTQGEFRIRGVGIRDYATNNSAAVAVYMDQTFLPFPVQTQFPLFDLERVEVLRGPQGTLYGRNSTGGAIALLSRRPTAEAGAGFAARLGSRDARELDGYLSGPLGERVRGRLSFSSRQGGAWQKNRLTGAPLGDADVGALRGQLAVAVSDALDLLVIASAARDRSDSRGPRAYLGLVPNPRGMADGYTAIPPDRHHNATGWGLRPEFAALTGLSAGDKPHRDNLAQGLSVTANWDLGGATLTSITSWQSLDREEFLDWDGSHIPQSDEYFDTAIDTLSQELRLTSPGGERFNWLLGAYYGDESLDERFHSDFAANLGFATRTAYRQDADMLGVFGQADHALGDRLRLVAGLRHEREDRALGDFATTYIDYPSRPDLAGTPTFAPLDRRLSTSEWSGKLALEYRPAAAALFYGSLGRGMKSGGFTANNALFPQQTDPVAPEIVTALEFGFKVDLSARLRVNGALFLYDYRDQQFQSTVFVDPVIQSIGRLVNIPKSELRGAELELLWEPLDGLHISQYLGYKRGTYREFLGVDAAASRAAGEAVYTDFAGERLPLPAYSYGGTLSHERQLGDFRVKALVHYAFHDSLDSTTSGRFDRDAYWLANARLELAPPGSAWRIALWCHNLFASDHDLHTGSFLANAPIATAGPPRSLGLEIRYNY